MSRQIFAFLFALFACAGSLFAQLPVVVGVDELASDDVLVPFRKLISEYTVAELASCDRVKSIGYDKVNSAKQELNIVNLRDSGAQSIDKVCAKIGADFICVGKVGRDASGKIVATYAVYKAGSPDSASASAELKGIEDCDDAAKSLAVQIGSIVKSWGVKPAPAAPAAPAAAPASDAK